MLLFVKVDLSADKWKPNTKSYTDLFQFTTKGKHTWEI